MTSQLTPHMVRCLCLAAAFIVCFSASAQAKDRLELKTIKIKGNKELPKIMYLVPWQEEQPELDNKEQKLRLHYVFDRVYQPLTQADLAKTQANAKH
ncbi:hypothetical protein [Agaribacterium haliotis]|uniref:hypothetical protein n=1 Tax=Agaribacterium haliotis TaxID=2013869 RepID=UPI000BB58FD7|nr:hypothetical protein [Agaribacterium haliotis]